MRKSWGTGEASKDLNRRRQHVGAHRIVSIACAGDLLAGGIENRAALPGFHAIHARIIDHEDQTAFAVAAAPIMEAPPRIQDQTLSHRAGRAVQVVGAENREDILIGDAVFRIADPRVENGRLRRIEEIESGPASGVTSLRLMKTLACRLSRPS